MTLPIRIALAAILLSAAAGIAWSLASPRQAREASPPAAQARFEPAHFTSSQQCRECHQEVWDEWHGTQHQIAYENPEVRKLSNDFRTKECQACHLPKPVFQTGLLNRTLPRETRRDEGVGCLSCHEGPDGRIVGRHTMDEAPCTPVAHSEFIAVALCETCHNQHGTTDEYRASPFAGTKSCNDCHMPEVTRKDGRKGRSHVMPGGHDLTTLRAAASFTAERLDNTVVLRLTNDGAGHNYPTEERSRALDFVVRFLDADGAPILAENAEGEPKEWRHVYRFRNPYRDEPLPNTQLPSGESHEERIPAPPGTRVAQARLVYRRNPFLVAFDDPEVLIVEEREVDFE